MSVGNNKEKKPFGVKKYDKLINVDLPKRIFYFGLVAQFALRNKMSKDDVLAQDEYFVKTMGKILPYNHFTFDELFKLTIEAVPSASTVEFEEYLRKFFK